MAGELKGSTTVCHGVLVVVQHFQHGLNNDLVSYGEV